MDDAARVRWARTLTTAGWMFVIAYVGYLTGQIRLAAAITQGSFEDGVWGERIERVSFAALPQNLMILVPAAAAAAAATVLVAGCLDRVVDRRAMWLAQLVRIVAGICYVVIVLALAGIIGVLFRNADSVGDVWAVLGRLGGILISVAILKVCGEAERTA